MATKTPTIRRTESLFTQLGGKSAIGTVVDKFYAKVLADPDLKPFFAKTNMTWLKLRQTQFMTQALGGPAEYKGRPMKAAHADMLIEPWHFERVGTHLAVTLSEMGAAPDVVDGVMEKISALEQEIVSSPAEETAEEPQHGHEENTLGGLGAVRMRAMLDAVPVNVMLADEKLRIIYVNPASLRTLKSIEKNLPVPAERVLGATVDVFHKDPAYQRRILSDPKNLPHNSKITIGEDIADLTATATYDEHGTYVGPMVTWEIITEKLRNQQDYGGQVAAIGRSQAVIEFNMDGTVITANENFLNALGYALEDIKGKHHGIFVEDAYRGSAEYKEFWSKLNHGKFQAGEFKRIGKGGREVWIQASYNPILDLNGKPFKVVKYATDITQQKLAADDLRQKVAAILVAVSAASRGDLTQEITVSGTDAIGQVGTALAQFLQTLRTSISRIGQTSGTLSDSSSELTTVSQQMSAAAEETSAQAGVVSAASEEVSRNLQTVATSTEEMSATIKEIAKNTTESAKITSEAVKVAQATNATVSKLGDSSTEIGQVIKVITSIAQQTNLLALNATIEAARAGEAGKGFAVVANEVKELAKETAKATEDISRKIEAIQTDTKGAVEAITAIGRIINQVNDISNSIATAVEEQDATTNEMTRNVTEAARGASEIAKNIVGVADAAKNTAEGANNSQKAASQLSQMSGDLRELVEQFKY